MTLLEQIEREQVEHVKNRLVNASRLGYFQIEFEELSYCQLKFLNDNDFDVRAEMVKKEGLFFSKTVPMYVVYFRPSKSSKNLLKDIVCQNCKRVVLDESNRCKAGTFCNN